MLQLKYTYPEIDKLMSDDPKVDIKAEIAQVQAYLQRDPIPTELLTPKMKNWSFLNLAQFYLQSERFRAVADGLSTLWDEQREKLRIYMNEDFRFLTQQDISNKSLVLGYAFYRLALAHRKKEDRRQYVLCLSKACEFHYINAYQTLFSEMLNESISTINTEFNLNIVAKSLAKNKAEERLDFIATVLDSWTNMLIKHITPGILLLANGYIQMAKLAANTGDGTRVLAAYKLTWRYLHLADLCLPQSTHAIHNVYFGRGLRYSNPFELEDIDEMKKRVRVAASELVLDDQTCAQEEHAACQIFNRYFRPVKAPGWSFCNSQERREQMKHALSKHSVNVSPKPISK